jgi:hypothetical protein
MSIAPTTFPRIKRASISRTLLLFSMPPAQSASHNNIGTLFVAASMFLYDRPMFDTNPFSPGSIGTSIYFTSLLLRTMSDTDSSFYNNIGASLRGAQSFYR